MLKRNYYCLVAGLPDLFFNENRPVFSSLEFRNDLREQLRPADFELVKLLFFPSDNRNLLNLLFRTNEPFDTAGNFTKDFLEEQLIRPLQLPDYMVQFIRWVKTNEIKSLDLQCENKLRSLFYEYVLQVGNSFVNEWFRFELNMKNMLTTINCSRFGYALQNHLIRVRQNSEVYSLLVNNRMKPEYFEEEVSFADSIFRVGESNSEMLEKEKSLDRIRWDFLDEQTFFHYFTIEKIISFLLKLIITERWIKLETDTGKRLLQRLINDLKTSFEFPAEFSGAK
jgi:hypothetical protein